MKVVLGEKYPVNAIIHTRATASKILFDSIFDLSMFKVSDKLGFNLELLIDQM